MPVMVDSALLTVVTEIACRDADHGCLGGCLHLQRCHQRLRTRAAVAARLEPVQWKAGCTCALQWHHYSTATQACTKGQQWKCSLHVWQRLQRGGLCLRLYFVVAFGLRMESCEAAVVAHDGGRVADPSLKLCARYRRRFRADRGVRRGLRPCSGKHRR